MFKIGDNIIYGMNGVMTVMDIRDESITGEEKTYYLLSEYGKTNSSITYVPKDNQKLISTMRPLLTKEEIYAAISNAKDMPDVDWIPDSRARTEAYRTIMRDGDRSAILAMMRTIHNTGLRRAEQGKKNYLTDENVMHKAESILYLEFSISLGISESEVKEMIDREIRGI